MALYERLLGYTAAGGPLPPEQIRIPQHAFCAMMAERGRGFVTNSEVIAAFNLDTGEVAELVTLVNRFTTGPTGSRLTREVLEDVMYVATQRFAPHDSIAAVQTRLGV